MKVRIDQPWHQKAAAAIDDSRVSEAVGRSCNFADSVVLNDNTRAIVQFCRHSIENARVAQNCDHRL